LLLVLQVLLLVKVPFEFLLMRVFLNPTPSLGHNYYLSPEGQTGPKADLKGQIS